MVGYFDVSFAEKKWSLLTIFINFSLKNSRLIRSDSSGY